MFFVFERHWPFNGIIIKACQAKINLVDLLENREGNLRLCTGTTEFGKGHTHPYHIDTASSDLSLFSKVSDFRLEQSEHKAKTHTFLSAFT